MALPHMMCECETWTQRNRSKKSEISGDAVSAECSGLCFMGTRSDEMKAELRIRKLDKKKNMHEGKKI
jgi:hypothetical protein